MPLKLRAIIVGLPRIVRYDERSELLVFLWQRGIDIFFLFFAIAKPSKQLELWSVNKAVRRSFSCTFLARRSRPLRTFSTVFSLRPPILPSSSFPRRPTIVFHRYRVKLLALLCVIIIQATSRILFSFSFAPSVSCEKKRERGGG